MPLNDRTGWPLKEWLGMESTTAGAFGSDANPERKQVMIPGR
jgi:hypothetical protein